VSAGFDAFILQAAFFAEGDCCLQEEAWARANRCVKDMFDMLMAVALALRVKILAKMVNSSDLPEELFEQLFETPNQETQAVAPVVGTTQTVVTQHVFPNITSMSVANLQQVIDFSEQCAQANLPLRVNTWNADTLVYINNLWGQSKGHTTQRTKIK
jgi:hypothetical protein